MKLCYPVCTPDSSGKIMAFTGGYENAFSHLKALGYQGVELLIRNPDTVDIPYLEDLLAHYRLKIAVIGTSPMQIMDKLFLLHPEDKIREEAMRRFYGLLALCRHFQVPALVGKYRGQTPQSDIMPMVKLFQMLCFEAEKQNVRLLLEPQNPTNINNIHSMEDALRFQEMVSSPALGIMADIYHMGITETDICESLRRIATHLGFVHMSDSDRKIPGHGILPIPDIMKVLREIAFDGYVSLEINQSPDSPTAAADASAYLQKEL